MTLDEAIKYEEEMVEIGEIYEVSTGVEGHRQLLEWLKELKQLREQKTEWITVSESLPEDRCAVLVWCPERKNIYCAYYEYDEWWIFGAYHKKVELEIIAWMPLPAPFEPQESEEKGIILDKIRAEIEALPKTYPFVNHIDMYVKEDDVKKIINKYRAGKE